MDNLKLMRRFYNVYLYGQIGEKVFTQFENLPKVSTGRKFYLSWSHYLKFISNGEVVYDIIDNYSFLLDFVTK